MTAPTSEIYFPSSEGSIQSIEENFTPQSSIYRMAAVKLAKNADLIILTAMAVTAISNIPGVSAGHCEATEAICVKTCMALGGPMPTETGSCLIGCKLAYWACISASKLMGF